LGEARHRRRVPAPVAASLWHRIFAPLTPVDVYRLGSAVSAAANRSAAAALVPGIKCW
jgi:hypothetical protein